MAIRRVFASSLAVVLLLALAPFPAVSDPPVLHVPVPDGPVTAVTTENNYAAFPVAARDAAGRLWVAYRTGANHAGPDGSIRLRFRDAGEAWSTPEAFMAATATHVFGPAGMVADSEADGGRLWLAVMKAHSTSATTADDYSALVTSRDPATGVWSAPVTLPAIIAGGTVISGLHIHNGELLATLYGKPAGAPKHLSRVYAYNRSTGVWSVRGSIAIANRDAVEPTLVTLANGNLLMLIRSDVSAPYYSYAHTSISTDNGATWSTPVIVVTHASGLMRGIRLASGEIAFVYRGSAEPVNPPSGNPLRIAVLNADGTAQQGSVESGHDVLGGDPRFFLYGQLVPDGDDHASLIWGAESAAGRGVPVGGATVYEMRLAWKVRSN